MGKEEILVTHPLATVNCLKNCPLQPQTITMASLSGESLLWQAKTTILLNEQYQEDNLSITCQNNQHRNERTSFVLTQYLLFNFTNVFSLLQIFK